METIKKYIVILPVLLMACGGKKNNPTPSSPGQVQLTAPAANSACVTGTNTASGQSTVDFTWNSSANTDNYTITIKNLLSGSTVSQTTSSTNITVALAVNTPYSWFITSKSGKTSATGVSDTWKFYNSGPGVTSYAPFPAAIVLPAFNQNVNAVNGAITLKWQGSDIDNDIAGYDVYLGTTDNPAILRSNNSADSLTNVGASSGTKYYWKVITKDSKGNQSDSGISEFYVN